MTEKHKIPLVFYRTLAGAEPVREWLKELPVDDRKIIGSDLLSAQWKWPLGMPSCRPLGEGLYEIRSNLPSRRSARVFLCFYAAYLIALHGFIKKTRTTPDDELKLARKRQKETQQ
jgi:phage-related protein